MLALAHRLEDAAIPGVVETVPTFRSLMVHYDPLQLKQAELKAPPRAAARWPRSGRERRPALAHSRLLRREPRPRSGRRRASARGSRVAEVAERHSGAVHHVYMMGFLPGLPYLGGLPPEFELPRRENPRIKVPSGAVAVAMAMTVIYPLESPGGWHILARTPVPLWDMRRNPPVAAGGRRQGGVRSRSRSREYEALLAEAAAGDAAACARRRQPRGPARMTAALRVVAPGLMTTLQDLGRPGYQHLGVPVSGALDPVSLRAANLLVGNPPGMGALEIAYQGPTLAVEADSVRMAFAGGQAPIDSCSPMAARRRAPAVLRKRRACGAGKRCGSARSPAAPSLYLAVEGGFDIAPVLGSQSTLRAGRHRRLGGPRAARRRCPAAATAASAEGARRRCCRRSTCAARARIRVVLGPQDDYFTPAGLRTLWRAPTPSRAPPTAWACASRARPWSIAKGSNIVSDGIAPGSIQVPGNGLPIVLLADRQTTGGYPKIATVISADLPALRPHGARRQDCLRRRRHRDRRVPRGASLPPYRGLASAARAGAARPGDRSRPS